MKESDDAEKGTLLRAMTLDILGDAIDAALDSGLTEALVLEQVCTQLSAQRGEPSAPRVVFLGMPAGMLDKTH